MKASDDSGAVDTVHSGDGDAMSTAVRFFFDISGMQEQLRQLATFWKTFLSIPESVLLSWLWAFSISFPLIRSLILILSLVST